MYAASFLLSAATTAATTGIPYFHRAELIPGIPIQVFGIIVAVGVLIGAGILRRYAEWHGLSDDHIRGLTGWITITGFIGAHLFDVIAYQWGDVVRDPLLLIKLWQGISSYGGFLGGSMGFAFYVWWKRLPPRLMADVGVVGLLPAFSIGRIGCTVVSDHVGAAVDPNAWYAPLAMFYPRSAMGGGNVAHLLHSKLMTKDGILAWNLGLVEFLYLVPVNALILYLAFRKKRMPAGLVAVLAGVLYPPVRFFLEFLRPENTDPRYVGFTFAQWCSILMFAVASYVALRLLQSGKPAEVIAPTSAEAQARLNTILKDSDEDEVVVAKATKGAAAKTSAPAKPVEPKLTAEEQKLEDARREEKRKKDHADEIEAAERRKRQDEEMAKKDEAAKAAAKKDAP